jgi:hypothetical protein
MTLLIHIGYHKTASTFLQEQVFNKKEFNFVTPWSRPDYYRKIILFNPFDFDVMDTRSFFEQKIKKAEEEKLIPVITEEALSGNIYQGGYNDYYVANRLFSVFPEAKILMVIRNQLDMIWSVYKHRLRSNLTVGINDYLNQIQKEFPGFEPFFNLDYLQYHWLINHYQTLFGKDKVLVLPYEMLREDAELFLEKISNFTGANINTKMELPKVNEGYSYLSLYVKRWTNCFAPRTSMVNKSLYQKINNSFLYQLNQVINKTIPKTLIQKVETQMKQIIAEKIDGYYLNSNKITGNLINIDLSSYGYSV